MSRIDIPGWDDICECEECTLARDVRGEKRKPVTSKAPAGVASKKDNIDAIKVFISVSDQAQVTMTNAMAITFHHLCESIERTNKGMNLTHTQVEIAAATVMLEDVKASLDYFRTKERAEVLAARDTVAKKGPSKK